MKKKSSPQTGIRGQRKTGKVQRGNNFLYRLRRIIVNNKHQAGVHHG